MVAPSPVRTPPNPLIELVRRMQEAQAAQDAAVMRTISEAYMALYRRLIALADAVQQDIINGKITSEKAARKLARYKLLMEDIDREMMRFQGWLGINMQTWAKQSMQAGLRDSQILARLSAATVGEVLVGFKGVNPAFVETMLAFLDPGGPLYKGMQFTYGQLAPKVADALIEGIGFGYNPAKVAKNIEQILGHGLTAALRDTRTAQLWAYREATRQNYINNSEIVRGWVWCAELDDVCCDSCLAMHGTVHDLDEVMDDHYNGRCAMIPALVGMKDPIETGESWFNKQTEDKQRSILGDDKYQALKEGKFEFKDMSRESPDPVFGMMRGETPLSELIKEQSNG